MDNLNDYIKEMDKKSPYLKIENGVAITGIYKGCKVIEDTFNVGTFVPQYSMEIDGNVKTFKSKSGSLARQMAKFKVGDEISVVRTGERFDTRWVAEKKQV